MPRFLTLLDFCFSVLPFEVQALDILATDQEIYQNIKRLQSCSEDEFNAEVSIV